MDSTSGGPGATGEPVGIPHRRLREETEAELIRAVGRGQLDLGMFSELSTAVWAAETPDEFRETVQRVPAPVPNRAAVPDPDRRTMNMVLGDISSRGVWHLPRELRIHSLTGDVTLDLREATMASDRCRITLMSLLGDCTLIIPEGVSVTVTATTVLGNSRTAAAGRPTGPEIEIGGSVSAVISTW
ncbi:LiaF domain-containing protein [Corynebacterium antarcticum]|uniref:LiaF domain-containing protein n=1 Tax=Corynebacterium antarcticum TaxID=2800405 RepID=UPI002004A21F|nr:LiaF domain-containing protein [Corynebacterium antarcticum]MCK7660012.1 LiaF-related protein [Corynebacterium antarcticum]